MREDHITIGVALRDLKCFSLDYLPDRLLIQKKVYLAQAMGVDLGYRYNWYLKGPYSPELTSAAYEVIPYGANQYDEYEFDNSVIEIFEKVNRLESHKSRLDAGLSIPDWYELLASMHYLNGSVLPNTKQNISMKLINAKPKYTQKDFDIAWDVLKEHGLI